LAFQVDQFVGHHELRLSIGPVLNLEPYNIDTGPVCMNVQ